MCICNYCEPFVRVLTETFIFISVDKLGDGPMAESGTLAST